MDIFQYIGHPEKLNRDSLYELRSLLARYPYYQSARLLYLQNLYLLHDASFGDELRKAAVYVADCRVLFDMIEGKNYVITPHERSVGEEADLQNSDRTLSLINQFLSTLPVEGEHKKMPVNPANDYVGYLLQMEDVSQQEAPKRESDRTDDLITQFITAHSNSEHVELADQPLHTPSVNEAHEEDESDTEKAVETGDDGCLTETLAKIYIRQQRYSKALEIIRRLNLKNPKKSAYFADQMRFLEKLIINNKNNKE